jgi:hypothetical protein
LVAGMRTTMFLATMLLLTGAARAEELPTVAAPRASNPERSYFEAHNDMVMKAFFLFASVPDPEKQVNAVDSERDRDRLRMFHEPEPLQMQNLQTGYGMALFSAMTVMAAHAPDGVRAIVDGPVHLGPAVFEGGGMGAAIGGRFL